MLLVAVHFDFSATSIIIWIDMYVFQSYQVEIHSLNIEPSDFCLYDRVIIMEAPFDNDNETDLQYFYCGDLDHIIVTAEGERIQIMYESDYSIPTLDEDFHHINITVKPGRAPVAPESEFTLY